MSTIPARLQWYRYRLASMSPAEVLYRVGEQGKRAYSRYRVPDFAAVGWSTNATVPVLPGLASRVRAVAEHDAALVASWRAVADDLRAGQLRLLGLTWPAWAPVPDWHLDPVTGQHWPAAVYCFDVPYRRNHAMGDVKYVWELGRLQYLQPVAALAAVTGDAELARLCAAHIRSFIAANPPFQGVHWGSGIELMLRSVSLIVVASLIGATFDAALRLQIVQTLTAHGYWTRRFPSSYSSANNHLIAEAAGLYVLGSLLPAAAPVREWRRFGRRTLRREVFRQIHPDGVGAEQSPSYTAFVLEWLLLAAQVAADRGRPFPPVFWGRVQAARQFLGAITDAGQHLPRIGDDDEGRVIFDQQNADAYIQSVIGAVSAPATAGRPVPSPPLAPMRHLRHAVYRWPQSASDSPPPVRQFPHGGYTVAKTHDDPGTGHLSEVLWVVDHGPLGYLSIAAHGHADTLAVWLHIGGRPVLVDAGTYLYHAGGHWRDHFRGTAAHNTLLVRGADSSAMTGPFNWGRRAAAVVRDYHDDPDRWMVEAEHDGYVRRWGVRHRRRVERSGHGVYQITDTLVADTLVADDTLLGAAGRPAVGHPVEIGFLIAPDLALTGAGGRWEVRSGEQPLLRIDAAGPLTGRIECGQTDPPRGWYSPRFGDKQPTTRLVFTGSLPPATSSVVTLAVRPTARTAAKASEP